MTKVLIDTSVYIRFLTEDDPKKFEECVKIFDLIEQGKLRPYITNIIILEIQFVLIGLYKFSKEKVLNDIQALLNARNMVLIEKTETAKALEIYKKHNIKFADCLITTQIPPKAKLVSYDQEFSKIENLAVKTPGEILNLRS